MMRNRIIVVFIVVLAGAVVSCTPKTEESSGLSEEEILALIEQEQRYSQRDLLTMIAGDPSVYAQSFAEPVRTNTNAIELAVIEPILSSLFGDTTSASTATNGESLDPILRNIYTMPRDEGTRDFLFVRLSEYQDRIAPVLHAIVDHGEPRSSSQTNLLHLLYRAQFIIPFAREKTITHFPPPHHYMLVVGGKEIDFITDFTLKSTNADGGVKVLLTNEGNREIEWIADSSAFIDDYSHNRKEWAATSLLVMPNIVENDLVTKRTISYERLHHSNIAFHLLDDFRITEEESVAIKTYLYFEGIQSTNLFPHIPSDVFEFIQYFTFTNSPALFHNGGIILYSEPTLEVRVGEILKSGAHNYEYNYRVNAFHDVDYNFDVFMIDRKVGGSFRNVLSILLEYTEVFGDTPYTSGRTVIETTASEWFDHEGDGEKELYHAIWHTSNYEEEVPRDDGTFDIHRESRAKRGQFMYQFDGEQYSLVTNKQLKYEMLTNAGIEPLQPSEEYEIVDEPPFDENLRDLFMSG